MPDYRLYLFGAPRLEYLDQPVSIDTRKALAILAYLVVEGQPQRRDTLAALLWPESDQRAARAALRRTLSTLRRSLDESIYDFGRELISLHPDGDLWCDLNDFQALLEERSAHDHPEEEICSLCLEPLRGAIELYHADFMEGFSLRDSYEFDDWQFLIADRLRRQYAQSLERLVVLEDSLGNLNSAVDLAQKWLAQDRLHEPAHQMLMKLYAKNQQRSAALRQYRQCLEILEEELGVQPLEQTTAIYHQILEGESFQDPPIIEVGTASSAKEKAPAARTSFVGRQKELQIIENAYQSIADTGKAIAIVGEAGIGKTRLAEEFVKYSGGQSGLIIRGRGYRSEDNRPYGVWIDGLRSLLGQSNAAAKLSRVPEHWLGEIARLLPEVVDLVEYTAPKTFLEGPEAQGRLFEALRQFILAFCGSDGPGIIVLDDLNWADQASLDFIAYLTRSLDQLPILLIACWRDNANPQATSLSRIFREIVDEQKGALIELERLDPEEVVSIGESMQDIPAASIDQIVTLSEGLPFFVVEYLSLASDQDWLESQEWPLPASVVDLERARTVELDETSAQILTTAAVIGRSFNLVILQDASGRSETEVVEALEQLIRRNLMLERGSSGEVIYDFNHGLLREVTYQDISLARRRLLHRRVAEALHKFSRRYSDRNQWFAQIAFHYQEAGEDQQAAAFYLQAGDRAREVYANRAALEHYQTALVMGHPNKSFLREAIGDLYTLQGDYHAAISSYEMTAAQVDQEDLPRIEKKLGNLHKRMGNWDLAIAHYQAAMENLDDQEALTAAILIDWSYCLSQQNLKDKALELSHTAQEIAAEEDFQVELAQANNMLGILSRDMGNLDQAQGHFEKVLEIAAGNMLINEQIAGLNNLSIVQRSKKDYRSAIESAAIALQLCQKIGDRHREAALLNNLADLYHDTNDQKQSMQYLKQAVTIFTQIGMGQETYTPEIWMLKDW